MKSIKKETQKENTKKVCDCFICKSKDKGAYSNLPTDEEIQWICFPTLKCKETGNIYWQIFTKASLIQGEKDGHIIDTDPRNKKTYTIQINNE